MEKAPLISDDGPDCLEDGVQNTPAEMPRMSVALRARFPHPPSGQVLVTFRGVAVQESLVRYVQLRSKELGLADADTLHVVLSAAGSGARCRAVVRARIGACLHEHGASGSDSQQTVQAALDALMALPPRPPARR
jgi:hypothetical protein